MHLPNIKRNAIILILILFISCIGYCQQNPQEIKPWTTWWWMGNIIDENGIEKQLELFDSVGIGGVYIVPAYGVKNFKNKYIELYSERWFDLLKFALKKAYDLDMGVDIGLSSGYPLGGKLVNEQIAEKKMSIIKIDTLLPDTTIRATIDSIKTPNDSIIGIFAISEDFKEHIDIKWLIDKPNYTEYFMPSSGWNIYLFLSTNSEQEIYLSTPDNNGPVIDNYSNYALNQFTDSINNWLLNLKNEGYSFRAISDSKWEILPGSWTDNFFEEFKKNRKYDLKPYLYLFLQNIQSDIQNRVMCDYFQTISELIENNYYGYYKQFASDFNSIFRGNTMKLPGNILDLYPVCDIPEIATYGSVSFKIPMLLKENNIINYCETITQPLFLKFVSSTANVAGKHIVCGEVGNFLGINFNNTLSQIKPEIDQLFLNGINHIMYYGITYLPEEITWPGWMYLNSTNFGLESHNWNDIEELNKYIYYCQEILQNSTPDNEILIYFPVFDYWSEPKFNGDLYYFSYDNFNEWFEQSSFGQLAYELSLKGYSFDYISDKQIQELKVVDKKIFSNGSKYKILFFPECNYIPLETLNKILELAENDIKIIFSNGLPKDIPGFYKYERKRLDLLDLKYALFVNPNISVIRDLDEVYELSKLHKEELAFYELNYIRKNYNNGKFYFISNISSNVIDEWIELGEKSDKYEIFCPISAKRGIAQLNNEGKIRLQIKPGQSLFIFINIGFHVQNKWIYNNFSYMPYEIEGEWILTFPKGVPDFSDTLFLDEPVFINSLENKNYQEYFGKIKYEISFDLPVEYKITDYYLLTINEIRETAEVIVNGINIGKIWCLPNELVINPKILKKRDNVIEIIVMSSSVNRIIKMDKENIKWFPDYDIDIDKINTNLFDASTWKPYNSGISGQILLMPLVEEIISY